MGTSSFRLPPPLSSTNNHNNNSSPSNTDALSSSRTRSLENINAAEKNPLSACTTNGNSSQYAPRPSKPSNLQSIGDANLSSSTESTNGIPFANENVGTIKQRSPHNHANNLYNSSLDPMKRSLPIQFFEQSNTHLLKPSYPMTTAIYDNNDRYISTNVASPNKQQQQQQQLRKPSTLTNDKRLQYMELISKDKQNKIVK